MVAQAHRCRSSPKRLTTACLETEHSALHPGFRSSSVVDPWRHCDYAPWSCNTGRRSQSTDWQAGGTRQKQRRTRRKKDGRGGSSELLSLYEDCRRSRPKRDHFLFKKLLRALIEIWNKLSERSNLSVSKLTQSCRYRAQILQNLRFSRITIRIWQALALRPNRFRRNPLLRRHTLVMRNRQKDSRTSKEGPHTLPGRKVIRICFLEQQNLTIRDLTALYPTPATLYMQIRRSTANTKHFTLSSCNTSLKNLTTVRRLRSVSRTRSCKQPSCKCNSLSLSLSLSQCAHRVPKSLSETTTLSRNLESCKNKRKRRRSFFCFHVLAHVSCVLHDDNKGYTQTTRKSLFCFSPAFSNNSSSLSFFLSLFLTPLNTNNLRLRLSLSHP